MALNVKVEKALNEQINKEFWSSYLYLSMANYLADQGFAGASNWMRVQFEEEQFHASRMIDYVNERNGRVILKPIKEVPATWDSLLAVFKSALEHEESITASINACMDIAMEARDHAAAHFLQWFVNEQVEEEANVTTIVDNLLMVGETGNGVYMIDKELATRVFVAPVITN